MNIIFGILVILLLVSGLFDFIAWQFNIIAIAVLVVIWLVSMYNKFVSLRNRVEEA